MYRHRGRRFARFARLCGNCAPAAIHQARGAPVGNLGYAEPDARCENCGAIQER
jgi:hypothetical protein